MNNINELKLYKFIFQIKYNKKLRDNFYKYE